CRGNTAAGGGGGGTARRPLPFRPPRRCPPAGLAPWTSALSSPRRGTPARLFSFAFRFRTSYNSVKQFSKQSVSPFGCALQEVSDALHMLHIVRGLLDVRHSWVRRGRGAARLQEPDRKGHQGSGRRG